MVVPAALLAQWRRVAAKLGVSVTLQSHETLSRGGPVPDGDLVIVDEAHRFRNPRTKRYDAAACRAPSADLLLLTATPVVNQAADLLSLLALFLPDNALAVLGVPSLTHALDGRDYARVAAAVAAAIVARTPAVLTGGSRIPPATDAAVVSPSPLAPPYLADLTARFDQLRFAAHHRRGPGRFPRVPSAPAGGDPRRA